MVKLRTKCLKLKFSGLFVFLHAVYVNGSIGGAMKSQGQGKPKATLVKSVREIMVPCLLTIVLTHLESSSGKIHFANSK